ncbi:MAG: ABC transporter permease subunit [Bacteriovoracaceae bacterium]|jgi:ABC-2 type transport system permease protein|nr:ABC transporter permease subunit [Bacteriovoracaceae bacterium]
MMHHTTKAIIKRELKSYFTTPLGYVFTVIFLFAIGYVTFEPGRGSFFVMRQADLSSFFRYIPWLFIFLIPSTAMRLWAEERKSGTIEFLLTLPVTVPQAVLGKFIAAWIFIALALLGTMPIVFTVAYLGKPDYGVIFLGYFASLLLAGSFLAVGTFFSAITKNQVVSFILSVVFCYIFLMAGSPPILETLSTLFPKYMVSLFEELSILNHFESMGRGVVRLSDLWFFGAMIVGWVYASMSLLDYKKAN